MYMYVLLLTFQGVIGVGDSITGWYTQLLDRLLLDDEDYDVRSIDGYR